jgi:hypothetical protein
VLVLKDATLERGRSDVAPKSKEKELEAEAMTGGLLM